MVEGVLDAGVEELVVQELVEWPVDQVWMELRHEVEVEVGAEMYFFSPKQIRSESLEVDPF